MFGNSLNMQHSTFFYFSFLFFPLSLTCFSQAGFPPYPERASRSGVHPREMCLWRKTLAGPLGESMEINRLGWGGWGAVLGGEGKGEHGFDVP